MLNSGTEVALWTWVVSTFGLKQWECNSLYEHLPTSYRGSMLSTPTCIICTFRTVIHMKQEGLPGKNPTRALTAEWFRTGIILIDFLWGDAIISGTPLQWRVHILRRVPNDELLAHEARFDEPNPVDMEIFSHHLQGFYTTNSAGFLLQQYGCHDPYKTVGWSSYPFKGDLFWMSLPQRTPWLKSFWKH